jgi:dienelactone hydrolase
VFLEDDLTALDILSSLPGVDEKRIGCGGLSGGGLRTNYVAGLDDRIRCAVSAGFMSTWKDFLVHKSHTHTWMMYLPLLPRYMDYPEILSMRIPLPTMVLYTEDDPLYTLEEVEIAVNTLGDVYKKARVPDHYSSLRFQGPHKFDLPMQKEAFDWFERWLL